MRRSSKAERIIRNRKILLATGIIFTFIFAFTLYSNRAAAENSQPVYTYYTSYEIQPGDTLWTIADQFMSPEFSDKAAFIDNLKAINHIGGDNITAGKYLIVQYSSYEELN